MQKWQRLEVSLDAESQPLGRAWEAIIPKRGEPAGLAGRYVALQCAPRGRIVSALQVVSVIDDGCAMSGESRSFSCVDDNMSFLAAAKRATAQR